MVVGSWVRLEQPFNQLTNLRLLIGRDPAIQPAERSRIDLQKYYRREQQLLLQNQPYNLLYKQRIDRLISYLNQDHIHLRLYGVLGENSQFMLHKTDIKRHNMKFYCLLPASTGTVGSTPSTGIDGQADRISQIYTCV